MDSGLVRKRSIDKAGSEGHDSRDMPWALSVGLGKPDSSRHSNDSACSNLSCLIGALLIALGVCLMWWADLDTKQSEQLAAVQREVDAWEKLHKNSWQFTQWELLVNETVIGKLLPSPQSSIIEQGSSISVTSAQRNRMNIVGTVFPFSGSTTLQDGDKGQPVTEVMQQSVKIEVRASKPGSEQQKVQLHNGPIVWTESKLANSWKGCHYADRGYWDAHTRQCISWHFLAKLCVKLEIEPNTGRWRSSNRYGNVGCNVYQQFEPVGSHKLRVQNWRVNTPPNITMEQAYKSTVAIYDSHDPFLFVANLTQGGMVLAEDKVNEVALGITFAVFGFVLMVPFALLKIIALFDTSRKQEVRQFDEIPFYTCEVDDH